MSCLTILSWLFYDSYLLDCILSNCTATSLDMSGVLVVLPVEPWPQCVSISWVLTINEVDEFWVELEADEGTWLLACFTLPFWLIFESLVSSVWGMSWVFCFRCCMSSDPVGLRPSGKSNLTWRPCISFLGVDGKDNKAWRTPFEVPELTPTNKFYILIWIVESF